LLKADQGLQIGLTLSKTQTEVCYQQSLILKAVRVMCFAFTHGVSSIVSSFLQCYERQKAHCFGFEINKVMLLINRVKQ